MSDYQNKARVCFSARARRELDDCAGKLGLTVSEASICEEVGFYIAAHEGVGIEFDTECQQLDYGEGLVLLLKKKGGWWEVIDVQMRTAFAYVAVWVWKRVARGFRTMLGKVVAMWRMVPLRTTALAHERT